LMVMNYFLAAAGAEFDLVINLDGFNEVTMPLVENRLVKVSAGFPREWRTRTDPLEPWAFKPILMIRTLKILRQKITQIFLLFPLSHSYTATAAWYLIDNMFYKGIYHYHQVYFYDLPEKEIEALGPYREFLATEALYAFMVNLWARSSKSLGALGHAYNFRYFHFLQPNLHFPDTKPWSKTEKNYREGDSPYPDLVKNCYPALQKKGKELAAEGENFYDLTRVFENNPETLYSDDCCHLEPEGSRILARAIGKIIAENYDRSEKVLKA
jgi:hypothetical protein